MCKTELTEYIKDFVRETGSVPLDIILDVSEQSLFAQEYLRLDKSHLCGSKNFCIVLFLKSRCAYKWFNVSVCL